ncbi:MAG: hypothetical protein JW749_11495 [Sedimentisphaerales bacterium]|nr:hypothetical protein [Sedimentisphaerales bacterium]
MKKWLLIIVLLIASGEAMANPVNFDPNGWIGWVMVLGSTLGLEAIVTAVILLFCNMELWPTFAAVFLANIFIFFAIFRPVVLAVNNLLVAEAVIVAIDAAFIKIISMIDIFQGEGFNGLKWRTAFICAAIGNVLSYFMGNVITKG